MRHILILVLMVVASFTVKAQRYGNFDAVNLRPVLESEAGVIYNGKFYYDKTCTCFRFRENNAWVKLIRDGDKGDITISGSETILTIDAAAVTETKIADNAVTNLKIADNAVTTLKINNSAVTTSKINNANVTYAKIQNLDAFSVLGNPTNASGVSSSIAAVTDGHVLRLSGSALGFGTVANTGLANSSISFATGTTGTDVNWSSASTSLGGTATLNIPSASSTARGVVTTGTQTFAGAKTFTGNVQSVDILIGNPSIGSGTINGITTSGPAIGLSAYNPDGNGTTVTPSDMTVYGGTAHTTGNNKGGSIRITGGNGNGTGAGGDIILDVDPSNATPDGKLIIEGLAVNNNNTSILAKNSSTHEITLRNDISGTTFTPVFTLVTNADAATAPTVWRAMRIGDLIYVSGAVQIDATALGLAAIDIEVPGSPNFTSANDGSGTAVQEIDALTQGAVFTDATTDKLRLRVDAVSTSARTFSVHAMYKVTN